MYIKYMLLSDFYVIINIYISICSARKNVEPFCMKPKHPYCSPDFRDASDIVNNCAPFLGEVDDGSSVGRFCRLDTQLCCTSLLTFLNVKSLDSVKVVKSLSQVSSSQDELAVAESPAPSLTSIIFGTAGF
ncbi:hypothetical protein DBV15_02455 [Temnothorax longispinosus]|uniref:Uncharacterized protein n=1 Tax=Temnothorax longispinosus TaxID=300112 RepID=A0A4S2KW87_9HYME|nr:hypothetical protein DBV15_02455 [Temnothorax longispinosus]